MEDYEKEIITKAIEETGTIAEASRKLNISKQDLNYKMKNTDSGDLLLLWERCRKKIFTDVKSFSLNDLESKKFSDLIIEKYRMLEFQSLNFGIIIAVYI